ncbi:MAG: hypothetical protein GY788_20930 [bacterium]|nr:hypothetical protein [bacterium]
MYGASVEQRSQQWDNICRPLLGGDPAKISPESQSQLKGIAEGIISSYIPPGAPAIEDLVRAVGAPNEQRPNYRLRVKTPTWTVFSIMGKPETKGLDWADIVAAAVDAAIKDLDGKQQTGEWRPVAFRLEFTRHKMRSRVGTGASLSAVRNPAPQQDGVPAANPQLTTTEETRALALRAEIVFADLLQGEPVDVWLQDTGKTGAPISKYAETGYLKHMPRPLRAHRELALEVLYDVGGLDPVVELDLGLDDAALLKFSRLDALPFVDDEDLRKRFDLTPAGIVAARELIEKRGIGTKVAKGKGA